MSLESVISSHVMEALTALCLLVLITGAWLFLVITRSKARRLKFGAFGVSIEVEMERRAQARRGAGDE